MRNNGTLFVVFSLLALFWGLKLVSSLYGHSTSVPAPGSVAPPPKADSIQSLLSGEFKRQPRKNPEEGAGLLRCRVRDMQGDAVDEAVVRVTPCDPDFNPLTGDKEYPYFWEGLTDGAGRVDFRTLPEGHFLILASLDGASGLAQVRVAESGAFSEAEVDIYPAEPRRGEINAAGAPVSGARIIPIYAEDFPGDSALYRHLPVISEPDGRFEHPLLPAGAWQMLVVAPHLAPKILVADEDGVYRASLDAGEKLSGRVVREADERPVNNAKVELLARDKVGESYSTRANGQGYFSFEGLRPANYTVRLAPGELRGEIEVAVAPESLKAQPAATPLSRNMKIDPLTGAAVVNGAPASPVPTSEALPQAPPVIQLKAVPSGSIRGRVLEGAAEVGVPGAQVALYPVEAGDALQIAQSDQAGYYQLKSLAPGTYRIAALRARGRVFEAGSGAEVTVSAGVQQPGPVLREVPAVSLQGTVIDAKGLPLSEANVMVAIKGAPGKALAFGSDRTGHFEASGFSGVDQVELWAVWSGQESPRFGPVTIGPSGLQDIVLRMPLP